MLWLWLHRTAGQVVGDLHLTSRPAKSNVTARAKTKVKVSLSSSHDWLLALARTCNVERGNHVCPCKNGWPYFLSGFESACQFGALMF